MVWNWGQFITTATGYLMPMMVLAIAFQLNHKAYYLALGVFSLFMGITGMGKILPFFGQPVLGGSLYFPTSLLCIVLAARYLPDPNDVRRLIYAMLLATVFFVGAQARWLAFAHFAPDLTTHEEGVQSIATTRAMIGLSMIYLSGMVVLLLRDRLRQGHIMELFYPLTLIIVMTMPLALYAGIVAGDVSRDFLTENWLRIIFWTTIVRLSLPVVVLFALSRMKLPEDANP